MKTIQTEKGGLQTIIKQEENYTLLAKYYDNGEFHEYVVAYGYSENGTWLQGHYFWHDLDGALDYFRSQTNRNYIGRNRLEEIATIALHGLVDGDVYELFEDDLSLEENEIDFFGIGGDCNEESMYEL